MAFWGGAFVFDGIPCEEYELMVYDIGSHTQSGGKFASTISIVEDKVSSRWKPYFYGVTFENKLTFTMVFGVNEQRVSANDFLSRREMEMIASWLTGHSEYKWLEMIQPDMEAVRYRCMITGLEIIEYGWIPWAFKATVECDGPYGYMYPQEYVYDGNCEVVLDNMSSHNGYFYPVIRLALSGGGNVSIENESDGGRIFALTGLPTFVREVVIDCDKEIITDKDGMNLYPHFNFKFFRLIKGENRLKITCDGTVTMVCEFPINTGG